MGRRLGKYVLSNRRVRKGSDGVEVKLGRVIATNQSVTVKAFDTSTFARAADNGVRELIKFEVDTMSRTNHHPNVVQLIDVLSSPSKIFVVMETVSGGGDLFEAIAAEGRCELAPAVLCRAHCVFVYFCFFLLLDTSKLRFFVPPERSSPRARACMW